MRGADGTRPGAPVRSRWQRASYLAEGHRWNGSTAYAENKLHDAMLAFAVARRWPDVLSNAVEPGWVATRMGGPGAPDDIDQAHLTQAWLAASDDPAARTTGGYFYHLSHATRTRRPAISLSRTGC